MIKFPKNDSRFSWTTHIKNKMVFYHISPNEIKTIFQKPNRTEEGIAPNTIAAMRVKKTRAKDRPETETWIMYKLNQKTRSKITMISAWRYPGRTKPGERPQIPVDILEELDML